MDSKSDHEKFLEQIASFDPLLNPSDFENIKNENKAKKQNSNSDLSFLLDNSNNNPKKLTNKPLYESSITAKTTKTLSDDSEKLKSINNSQNAFYNVDTHYHESPARVPLSTLALPEMNQLSLSHSNVTQNIPLSYTLSPESSKKSKEKNINDQSPHHSFNSYHFNNNTNISSSSGSYKNDGYGSNIASQNKKFECKAYINRAEYNSSGGTASDCVPSLRRRSFQTLKTKNNSVQSYKSGRFNITLSSHSEVSQSENSSCDENEKKKESKNKNEEKDISKESTKNRKVKRFKISYSSNDSNGNLTSDYDIENAHLKHASSDKTVNDHRQTSNNSNNCENTKNILMDSDIDDDIFYQMQQSSMPVLGRHKKKSKDGNNSKPNKNITSNNNNENMNQHYDNNELSIIDWTTNPNPNYIGTSNTNINQNQNIKTNKNINAIAPPKSTPVSPPLLEISLDSTSTTDSLLGKQSSRSENIIQGNTDDLINIF